MPFVKQQPRVFTSINVKALNQDQFGIYGLLKYNTLGQIIWIYVGRGDIKKRLLDHLNGDNPCISRMQPSHWVGELVAGDSAAREKQLILELDPSCNQKVG